MFATACDGLRERRPPSAERRAPSAERRQLRRDLASYTTFAEVDHRLDSLRGQDEGSDDEIRTLVLRNLHDDPGVLGLAP